MLAPPVASESVLQLSAERDLDGPPILQAALTACFSCSAGSACFVCQSASNRFTVCDFHRAFGSDADQFLPALVNFISTDAPSQTHVVSRVYGVLEQTRERNLLQNMSEPSRKRSGGALHNPRLDGPEDDESVRTANRVSAFQFPQMHSSALQSRDAIDLSAGFQRADASELAKRKIVSVKRRKAPKADTTSETASSGSLFSGMTFSSDNSATTGGLTAGSLFGSKSTSSAPATSLFGSGSMFGGSSSGTTGGLFGSAPDSKHAISAAGSAATSAPDAAPVASSSLFGATSSGSSLFGGSGGLFGASPAAAAGDSSGSGSLLGGAKASDSGGIGSGSLLGGLSSSIASATTPPVSVASLLTAPATPAPASSAAVTTPSSSRSRATAHTPTTPGVGPLTSKAFYAQLTKLNSNFADWVAAQRQENLVADWSAGLQDYIVYASDLMQRHSEVTDAGPTPLSTGSSSLLSKPTGGTGSSGVSGDNSLLEGLSSATSAPASGGQSLLTTRTAGLAAASTSGSLFATATTSAPTSINSLLQSGSSGSDKDGADDSADAETPMSVGDSTPAADGGEDDFLLEGEEKKCSMRSKMFRWRDSKDEDGNTTQEWGDMGVGQAIVAVNSDSGSARVLFVAKIGSSEKVLVNGAMIPDFAAKKMNPKTVQLPLLVTERVLQGEEMVESPVMRKFLIRVKTPVQATELEETLNAALKK